MKIHNIIAKGGRSGFRGMEVKAAWVVRNLKKDVERAHSDGSKVTAACNAENADAKMGWSWLRRSSSPTRRHRSETLQTSMDPRFYGRPGRYTRKTYPRNCSHLSPRAIRCFYTTWYQRRVDVNAGRKTLLSSFPNIKRHILGSER